MRLMWGYDDDSYQTVDVLPERKVLLDSARDGKAFSHEVWHGFRKMPKRARYLQRVKKNSVARCGTSRQRAPRPRSDRAPL